MSIFQVSARFSVLTFQFCNYRCLYPSFLEELVIYHFKERQWIFMDVYYFYIPKVPNIFNFLLWSWMTSSYSLNITLVLSPVNSAKFFSRRRIFPIITLFAHYYYWLLFVYKNSYVLCLHKVLHVNQIIKWKIISVGEPPRQILRYKAVFRINHSS